MFMINMIIWTPIMIMMIGKIIEICMAKKELRLIINKMENDEETTEG